MKKSVQIKSAPGEVRKHLTWANHNNIVGDVIMANGSLVNTALFGQSKAFNFSLTFTPDTWQQFWRCMVVGCVMSDYLMNTSKSGIATSWNELSIVVASLMGQGKIEQYQNETPESR